MTPPRRLRLQERQLTQRVLNPVVSIEHGYLWIGGDDGPCLVTITGKATLRKIAAMLLRYAR